MKNVKVAILSHIGDPPLTIDEISKSLDARLQQLKRSNPRGFMDEFESRFDLFCAELAESKGGRLEFSKDGEYVFNFTGVNIDKLVKED